MLLSSLICMATAIYFEARGEPLAGKIAVGNTIVNRVEDTRFPDTVCDVVTQGPTYSWKENYPVKNRCQFSFYCDGKSDYPKNQEAMDEALLIAEWVIERYVPDLSEGATHYHATYVLPSWASTKTKTVTINNHVFYRWQR